MVPISCPKDFYKNKNSSACIAISRQKTLLLTANLFKNTGFSRFMRMVWGYDKNFFSQVVGKPVRYLKHMTGGLGGVTPQRYRTPK